MSLAALLAGKPVVPGGLSVLGRSFAAQPDPMPNITANFGGQPDAAPPQMPQMPQMRNQPKQGGGFAGVLDRILNPSNALGQFGQALVASGGSLADAMGYLMQNHAAQTEALQKRQMADQQRQQGLEDWRTKFDYERDHPKPMNNDTVNDYNFILEKQGQEAANQYLRNLGDPTVTVPIGNKVYTGPRSGLGAAMQGQLAPQSGPQPGTVEEGYRFKGGDPADHKNWEPVGGGVGGGTGGFPVSGEFHPTIAPMVPGNLPTGIRYQVKNKDGSVSTVRTISIGTDKGEVLIPTVVNGKILSDDEAVQYYYRTGENFGIFKTPADATAYAKQLHGYHEGLLHPPRQYGTSLPVNSNQLDRVTVQAESAFNPNAVSPKGAQGLWQVMPATARDPGFGIRPSNGSPQDTARVGAEYRRAMETRYNGDLSKMWAAYNWGPGNLDNAIAKHGNNWLSHAPSETKNYVRRNMRAVRGN